MAQLPLPASPLWSPRSRQTSFFAHRVVGIFRRYEAVENQVCSRYRQRCHHLQILGPETIIKPDNLSGSDFVPLWPVLIRPVTPIPNDGAREAVNLLQSKRLSKVKPLSPRRTKRPKKVNKSHFTRRWFGLTRPRKFVAISTHRLTGGRFPGRLTSAWALY